MNVNEIILGKVVRTAYEYAVKGGYTGTEEEFSAALVTLKDAPFLALKGGTMDGNIKVPEVFGISTLSGDGQERVRISGGSVNFVYGDGGFYICDESREEQKPVAILYGLHGDEPVIIRNVSDPEEYNDAANKRYADAVGVPIGGIIIWSGASNAIPAGWALCNGENGTPDLTDRFVIGAGGTYHVGFTGGSPTHTLTVEEMPKHSHGVGTLSTESAGAHTHTYEWPTEFANIYNKTLGSGGVDDTTKDTSEAGEHTHTITGSTASVGSGKYFDIMPPYYALCYIMRIS